MTPQRLNEIKNDLEKHKSWFAKFGYMDKSKKFELNELGRCVLYAYELLDALSNDKAHRRRPTKPSNIR